MPNVQCPGCGTLVAVDPAAGHAVGCPNCRTPLGVAGAPPAQIAPQARSGEMPVGSPPPAGSVARSARAGEMPVASPPPPGATIPQSPQIRSPQIPAPQPLPQPPAGAGGSPGAAPSPLPPSPQNQFAIPTAAPLATPPQAPALPAAIARPAPAATVMPTAGAQVTSSRHAVRRKSAKSNAGLYTILIAAAVGFVVLIGAPVLYLTADSNTRVTTTPANSPSKSVSQPAKSDRPGADKTPLAPTKAAKIEVQIQSVEFDAPRGRDAAGVAKALENKCLVVYLKITNTGNAAAKYESWYLRIADSPEEIKLVDDGGHGYPAITFPGSAAFKGHTPKANIAADDTVNDALLFRVPADFSPSNVKSLGLTLSGKAVGQTSEFQLTYDKKIVEL